MAPKQQQPACQWQLPRTTSGWLAVGAAAAVCCFAVRHAVQAMLCNNHPNLRFCDSAAYQQGKVFGWFEGEADLDAPLFVRSGWSYMTADDYAYSIDTASAAAGVRANDSVFEFGCGVGAGLDRLRQSPGIGRVGGCDFAPAAVKGAQAQFPSDRANFFVRDAALPFPEIAAGSYDHACSFGAVAMYLTWPAMNRVLAESVRMVKEGGTVWLTHLIEPGRYDKASILTAVGMDRWDTAVRTVGGGNLIVRYMRPSSDAVHKTVQPCRYFIVFTKGSNAGPSPLPPTPEECKVSRYFETVA